MRMSRLPPPAAAGPLSATGAFALAVAVLAFVAAGCSNSGGHAAATATTTTTTSASKPTSSAPCKLDKAQRRAVARARADIRRLRRIQAPMQTFSQHGAPNQNAVTGKLMLDLGSAHLPVNVFAHLLHLGKAAVSLCGDCSVGLEGEEPVLGNQGRAEQPCG
jgi:hypothetical protein